MPDNVRIEWHDANIHYVATRTADRAARKAAVSGQNRARRLAPKDTGALAASITITKVSDGLKVTYRIGSPLQYARYQEFGTGPIVPVRSKVLRFKAGGVTVFAHRTRGVPATHFMARASRMLTIADFI